MLITAGSADTAQQGTEAMCKAWPATDALIPRGNSMAWPTTDALIPRGSTIKQQLPLSAGHHSFFACHKCSKNHA